MADEITGTLAKDGALEVKGKDADGKDIVTRYTLESDLLTIKGSRDELEKAAKLSSSDRETAVKAANTKAETANQSKLTAEAKVTGLEDQIKVHTGTQVDLDKLTLELKTAKEAGESSATELLKMSRTLIVATYGVPIATVETKSLEELKLFEEALKAVTGGKLGNYAIGGGGGAGSLQGKSPMELAQMAYAEPANK